MIRTRRDCLGWVAAALLIGVSAQLLSGQASEDGTQFPAIAFDHKAIDYFNQPPHDPAAQLEEKLQSGEETLDYDPRWGYLPSLLKHFDINIDSQVLVFSKTSFQAPRISPARPRALYFNDEVAIGSVQNGQVFEVISQDPRQGAVFYTLNVVKYDRPSFHHQDMACAQCHMIPGTLNVPGWEVSSVYPASDGTPILRVGATVTDQRTPFRERWGGWYVTGLHGDVEHRGNAVIRDLARPTLFDTHGSQNLSSLDGKFDTTPYLAPTSDIVALLTLEHQTRMLNLMTRLGWETRIAIADGKLAEYQARLRSNIEELVTYMLFADEAPLIEPVQGISSFTETFPKRGPRDHQGRSLRDFDLKTRLFRYPLSYLIYSKSFDSMPDLVKDGVYRRLYDVLNGADKSATFARLSTASRRAILEIVGDTKRGLPAYWNQ
jgi:hypothetical protein